MNPIENPDPCSVEAWQRLDAVCRKLWDENSPSAVEAQAVIEEFKGEVQQGQHSSFEYRRAARTRPARTRGGGSPPCAGSTRCSSASLKKRLELEEQSRHTNEKRIEELLKTLAQKEEQNMEFHSQILRVAAASDEIKTKKMEEFYQELMKKESSLAESWQQRHVALEKEHEHLQTGSRSTSRLSWAMS